ncbi:metallophosphoesterase [Lapidilactobacillus wuchangensis]|uniref:metallophosphoesterase n=1 Tax=Lapidilactobacillus wuchangensis TaxID=2486001 RepID=UPI000F7AEA05|nr:metallophosphoesterase [Lapidilactobacillus wuchangensis]
MTLKIFNLSDIHFTSIDDPIFDKLDSIKTAMNSRIFQSDAVLILVSGDIAFSGTIVQYEIAELFFNELINSLKNECHQLDIWFIPGNHDADFEKPQFVRNRLLKDTYDCDIDTETLSLISNVQENFNDFINNFSNFQTNLKMINSNELVSVLDYQIDGKSELRINAINSSWDSTISESSGSMTIPKDYLKIINYDRDVNFNVSLMHHPLNWYSPDNSRQVREKIELNSNWIITGHEHVETEREVIYDQNDIAYSEAGALQENNNQYTSKFGLYELECSEQCVILKPTIFSWIVDEGYFGSDEKSQIKIKTKKDNLNFRDDNFDISRNFSEFLHDIGSPIVHPRKKNLELDDVFIFPELEEKGQNESIKGRIDSKLQVAKLVDGTEKVWFVQGERESGKTSFLKKIFEQSSISGLTPLFVRRLPKLSDIKNFDTWLRKTFISNYDEKFFERYRQMPTKRKIILIDDWQLLNLNLEGKRNLIQLIQKRFGIVVIMSEFRPENSLDIVTFSDIFGANSISEYSLKNFGRKKREELINKWLVVGDAGYHQFEQSSQKRSIQIDQLQTEVTDVLGSSYVPQVPIYILIILQSLSSGASKDAFRKQTNGYYYEVLITAALIRIGVSQEKTNTLFNYLSQLAYELFKADKQLFEYDFWCDFHTRYTKKYAISPAQNKLSQFQDILIQSNIIKKFSENEYCFSYEYINFYFIAFYLSANITVTPEITKSEISNLIENSNKEINANILIFLIHHSKDSFILDEVIKQAQKLLPNNEELNLENDVGQINNLITELPILVLKDNHSFEENRLVYNEQQDRFDDTQNNKKNTSKVSLKERSIELVELDKAARISEIIGQVLKDYSGTIVASQKLELLEAAYKVSLRAGSKLLEIINSERDDLVKFVTDKIKQDNPEKDLTDVELKKISGQLVFSFCEMVCLTIVEKLIRDTGNKELEVTYRELFKITTNTAVKLTISGTVLEILYTNPKGGLIKDFYDSLKGNLLVKNMVQFMIARYLYFIDLPSNERQSISDKYAVKYNHVDRQRIQQDK